MRTKTLTPALTALFVAVAGMAAQDAESRISARDVFRAAQDMFYVQNKKTPKPAPRPNRPRPPRPAAGPATPPPAPAEPEVVAEARPERPSGLPAPKEDPQVLPAAVVDQPLGLRYSLLRKTPQGEAVEVDSASEFKSGDSIRLEVETSDVAYLYIVNKGSSGRWNVLFPSKSIAGGANRVDPDYRYVIPPGGWFTFDEQVGEEELFILLSRMPVDDLEQAIYEMDDAGQTEPQPAEPKGPVFLAQARGIDDATVTALRRAHTRDLVFEKVDDATTAAPAALSGAKAEKAVYVVTKAGGRDARVVADLSLVHR